MRTTVTLDDDAARLIRQRMHEYHLTFKAALNDTIRLGLAMNSPRQPFQTPTADLGVPNVNLDAALRIAGELEDEDLLRKQHSGK